MMTITKLYTTKEVQNILQVTQRTLYRYIKADQIKVIRMGREYRISEEALTNFISTGTTKNYLELLQSAETKLKTV